MLSRLLAKDVLVHEEEGRRYLYRPAIRDDYVAQESGRLIDRMFGGRVTPLGRPSRRARRSQRADIAEIEELLKGLKP